MNAKHTPGPWSSFRGLSVVQVSGPYCLATLTNPSKDPSSEDGDQTEEWKANARLMAAAPDMFDALIYARDEWEQEFGAGTCPLEIIDAIEYAMGTSPRQNAPSLPPVTPERSEA